VSMKADHGTAKEDMVQVEDEPEGRSLSL
jgi:hypothetical protein